MNKNLLIGLGIALLVVVAGYAIFSSMPQAPAPVPVPVPNPVPTPVPVPVPTPTPIPPVPPQPGAPTVQTSTNAVPSASTVVVTGNVTPNGALTTYWYEYGTSTALGTQTVSFTIGSGYASIYAPAYITGLKSNTTYHYRLSAKNALGTVNGATYSFMTNTTPPPQGSAPAAKSSPASGISQTTANLNGQVNPNGSDTTYWFEYGKTADFGFTTAFQSAGSGSSLSPVAVSISNLAAATKYYFRLNAQNQFGTVNGVVLNFTTSPAPTAPTVKTEAASNITSNTAKLNGTVNPNGDTASYWFEYSQDSLLGSILGTVTPSNTLTGNTTTPVSGTANNLAKNTKYYYRLVAQNGSGKVQGDIMSFTTKP